VDTMFLVFEWAGHGEVCIRGIFTDFSKAFDACEGEDLAIARIPINIKFVEDVPGDYWIIGTDPRPEWAVAECFHAVG